MVVRVQDSLLMAQRRLGAVEVPVREVGLAGMKVRVTVNDHLFVLQVVPPQERGANCRGGRIAGTGAIAGAAAVHPVKSASGCRRLVSGKETRRPAKWDSYAAIIISSAVTAARASASGGRRSS